MKGRILATVVLLAAMACGVRAEVAEERGGDAVPDLAELRKRTKSFYKRMMEDHDVLDSKEWKETEAAHGPAYKRELLRYIREAESITITERSDRMDFWPLDGDAVPYYEYGSVRLTEEDCAAFLKAVEEMDERSDPGGKRCIFEAHHRVSFLMKGGERANVIVCFKCAQVAWGEMEGFYEPMGMIGAIGSIVERVGLKTERDWRALAKARTEEIAAGKATAVPVPDGRSVPEGK